jgi:hypothetical protein
MSSVYTPDWEVIRKKQILYTDFQQIINKGNSAHHIILAGEFNARIGNQQFKYCVGSEEETTFNSYGTVLTDFCIHQIKGQNTFFRYKNIYIYTWKGTKTRSVTGNITISNKLKA